MSRTDVGRCRVKTVVCDDRRAGIHDFALLLTPRRSNLVKYLCCESALEAMAVVMLGMCDLNQCLIVLVDRLVVSDDVTNNRRPARQVKRSKYPSLNQRCGL